MIPFGEWLPDLGTLNNPGALIARNVIPTLDGYAPFPSQQVTSNALTDYARGAISIRASDGNTYVYAGDETNLYSLSSATWNDISRTVGGAYATDTEESWEFVRWGENVIATNFTDDIQTVALGGANFAALGGSPPRAKHIAVVRDFVVLGNIHDGTARTQTVKWSGFGDSSLWTPNPSTQSGEQTFPDGGPILRIVGGSEGVIFQEYRIRVMTQVGPPYLFRFDVVDHKKGALCPGGVVNAGQEIYFIGLDGFYRYYNREITNISDQKVSRTFFQDVKQEYLHRITGSLDFNKSIVVWSYPGAGSSMGQPNKLIIFHWPTGRWAEVEATANALFNYLSPGYTLEGLDALSTDIDALMASLDSPAYLGGALSFAGFNSNNELAPFEGSPMAATIDTKEIGGDMRSTVTDLRPYVTGGQVTCEHLHRANLHDNYTIEPVVSQHASGRLNLLKNDRYHRFRLSIPSGFEIAQGVDPVIRQAGTF